jgi:hypothetical protein
MKKNTCILFKSFCDLRLNFLKRYIDLSERQLKKELSRKTDKNVYLSNYLSGRPNEPFEYADDELVDVFPDILRRSWFILCYSFLEDILNRLCKYLHRTNSLKLSLNDISGKGIFRARTFLEKVACIEFPDDEPIWEDIIVFNYIRNFIIHNNSRMEEGKWARAIKLYMKRKKNIIEIKDKEILFRENFHNEIISTYKLFCEVLFNIDNY